MQASIDLCKAVGLDVNKMEPTEIYMASGRILADEPLRQATLKFLTGSVLESDAYPKAIAGMTPTERVALRERVSGIVAFPGKS